MSYQSEHDPRWHLGQCIVWIAKRDKATVDRVREGYIVGAIRAERIDHERCWYDLLGEFRSGRLTATAIPSGETDPRPIKSEEFHGLEIAFAGPGNATPYLVRRHRIAFTDVRVLREDLMKAFPLPAPAPAANPAPAPAPAVETTSSEPRKRGPKALKFERIKADMRAKIKSGEWTWASFKNMASKDLERICLVSRGTIRKARNAVMAEEGQYGQ